MNAHAHVVAGAGALGSALVRALLADDHKVRVVTRGPAEVPPGVEHVTADLADAAATKAAFEGAAVVYHCAAGPRPSWPGTLAPIMAGVIAGAEAAGAGAVVYADNLYAHGPVSTPLTEDLPYRPRGPKERVRAEVAEMLMSAHTAGRVRAVIGRSSDFFGPRVVASDMGERVFPAVLAGGAAKLLPSVDTPHTYTFVDDFARGLVTLGRREESYGEVWHVPSAPTLTTREFVGLAFAEAGTTPKISVAPKAVVAALGLVNPTMKAVAERLHQTEQPFVVDHSKFAAKFGDTSTPHEEALRQTLAWWRTA